MNRAAIFLLGLLGASGMCAKESPVTFTKDIAPILFKNCAACHHPGEVAPFSLLSYDDAAKRAKTIARVTRTRYMPPFKAEPGAGEFRDICRLNDDEIAAIQSWTDAGTPEGDPKNLPAAPVFSDTWKLGKPDVIVTMPQAFTIPAEGKDIYQCFVLPASITENQYLVAYEFRPGNRKVVHHSIISYDNTGEAQKKDDADAGVGFRANGTGTGLKAGFKNVLGIWTPGVVPTFLPDGIGLNISKNSVIVLQNHYHPSGKPETDQSSVGLYFSKAPVTQLAHYTTLFQNKIAIQPGDAHYSVTAQQNAGSGRVVAVTPHMHLLGDEMKLTATAPDGTVRPMIWIKNWDFNWQHQYFYKTPFVIEKGTRVDLVATFNNSAENPKNPNSPPKLVKFGENTTDEMAGVIFLVVDNAPASSAAAAKRPAVKVDPKLLQRYTGSFTLEVPTTLEITQESGTLRAKVSGKNETVDLIATSETEFMTVNPQAKLTFLKDENGEFARFTLLVDGKSHTGTRTKK